MSYEQLKLQWMIDHGFTLAELVAEIDEYQQDFPKDTPLTEVLAEWELNSGFGSMIWPCYSEAVAAGECEEEE